MFNSTSSTIKEVNSGATLAPVQSTDAELDEQPTKFDEKRGEKRPFSDADESVRVPITEKQLTILKNKAKELINDLDEILDLDFVKPIQKKNICNFTSARGDLRHFLERVTQDDRQADYSFQNQPSKKKPRREQKENTTRNMFTVTKRNGRQQRGRAAPSWPRPSGWSPRRAQPFNQPSMRQWGSGYEQPYSRVGPRYSRPRGRVGERSFFSWSDQISASRGRRSNAPQINRPRPRGLRSTFNSRSNMDRRKSPGSRSDNWTRCELCDVQLCGEASVKEHMGGKRHRAALEAQEGGSPVEQESEPTMHEINISSKE